MQIDAVRLFLEALEAHDIDAAMRLVGETFTVEAPGHYQLGFKDFCMTQKALWYAYPDLRYNATDIEQTPSLGRATVHMVGTFVHDLALPWRDMPIVPCTGELVRLPPERLGFTLEWGEILSIRTESETGFGLLGPVRTAGVQLPPPGLLG